MDGGLYGMDKWSAGVTFLQFLVAQAQPVTISVNSSVIGISRVHWNNVKGLKDPIIGCISWVTTTLADNSL